jgi:hypothetical protein
LDWRTLPITAALSLAALSGVSPAEAAPEEYRVGHFSDEFRATVTVNETSTFFQPGFVSVFERKSGKRLLRIESNELTFEVGNDEVAPNVVELPYGQQSVVIYEDFDFDGRADLAIMDGQNSCYHGPSFQIFVREGKGFVKSPAFTRLAQEYCGMFSIDRAKKQLYAMTKSGCCWHQFDTFDVVKRAPRLSKSVEESLEQASVAYLRRVTTGRQSTTETLLLPSEDSISKPLLAFDLAGPRARHVEVLATEGFLDYAVVVGPERRVEYSQRLHARPVDTKRKDAEPEPFRWDSATGELSFRTGDYRYVIHDGQKHGVSVHHLGKEVFMPAVETSRRGTLSGLKVDEFENVTSAAAAR